jgi:hypothetical protein
MVPSVPNNSIQTRRTAGLKAVQERYGSPPYLSSHISPSASYPFILASEVTYARSERPHTQPANHRPQTQSVSSSDLGDRQTAACDPWHFARGVPSAVTTAHAAGAAVINKDIYQNTEEVLKDRSGPLEELDNNDLSSKNEQERL